MFVYFLLIRIAALFGHRKARLMVEGQKNALAAISRLKNEPVVWFHAASVGEFEQARPIIERMHDARCTMHSQFSFLNSPFNTECKILLTFFSPSGYEMRKNYDKADVVAYLPFATRKNARRMLDTVTIQKAIFVKYEFWPAYLKELKRRNIETYSISAIFLRHQLFFQPWGKPYLNLLNCFTHIFVQDESSRELLARYHITHVSVAGDTRFDRVNAIAAAADEIAIVKQWCQQPASLLDATKPTIIVAGSTWPEDEALFARYLSERPDIKLVLVPHEIHDEHLRQIFQLFQGRYTSYTQANEKNLFASRLLVVDAMGLLSGIYRYADVAYIGGGFGVGIHNTLEAAVYGIPVLFGKNYQRFREAHGLIAAGASRPVKNYREFALCMDEAIAHAAEMGKKARAYVESELGATTRIMQEIFSAD